MAETDIEYLKRRLLGGSISAYSTTGFTKSQNLLLRKLVRQGKVIKMEQPMYSGPGNRYYYYWRG